MFKEYVWAEDRSFQDDSHIGGLSFHVSASWGAKILQEILQKPLDILIFPLVLELWNYWSYWSF